MRRFTHGGAQFVLGTDADGAYGIWRLGAHWDLPVQRWPATEDGWNEATRTLRSWDPAAAPLSEAQLQGLNIPPAAHGLAALSPSSAWSPYGMPASPQGSNGIATAGGTIGITGAVLSLIPLLGIALGLILGILAVVFSSIGLGKAAAVNRGRGLAVTGLVLGILTIVFKLIPGINVL